MDKNDITLPTNNGTFNYRVAAIILNDENNILMANNVGNPHYYTIGGRVHFGESIQNAVMREVFEETNLSLKIKQLAYIHENFFSWGADKTPCHEIAFFFLMERVVAKQNFDDVSEHYGKLTLHWLPIAKLKDIHIFPEFFKKELFQLLNNPEMSVRHFVTTETENGEITKRVM
ncbi:MAG: NUDIX domain-containing protein [Firmicutes bacterium]|nr:NUDIX domain-containing protein [Bacillota bacterium]